MAQVLHKNAIIMDVNKGEKSPDTTYFNLADEDGMFKYSCKLSDFPFSFWHQNQLKPVRVEFLVRGRQYDRDQSLSVVQVVKLDRIPDSPPVPAGKS